MANPSLRGPASVPGQSWGETFRFFAGQPAAELAPGQLEEFAVAAYLIGKDDQAVQAWSEAHRQHLDSGARSDAARCSFWAAFCLMMQGQHGHAGGWLRRTDDVIGDDLDCPARGYRLIPALLGNLDAGDTMAARDLAVRVGSIADHFADHDLEALATLGHGQALLAFGDETSGMALLDEAMLAVSSGEVGPIVSGIVYCAVVLECMRFFDLARAGEWAMALDEWCNAQPDLIPYRGQCLVHQSQLQQASGNWSAAVTTAESARDHLTDPPHPALGMACYQEGELRRLRGEFRAADDAYAMASRAGYHPMPGLAQLELARGQTEAAASSIRRALAEATQPYQRPPLLAAAVEILAAADDLTSAERYARELSDIAGHSNSELLQAMADHAIGSVLLAAGKASEALKHLRSASVIQDSLRLPHEAARTAVLLGCGCLALGDRVSARLEFDRARETFTNLDARPDLERLRYLAGDERHDAKSVLSARELEILRHVAAGQTNREIARELTISQHTVGRHLENIFAKLGLNSRAAATAYAYQHHLL